MKIPKTKQRSIVKQTAGKEGFGKDESGNMASEMMSAYIAHRDHLYYDPVDYGHVDQINVWPYSTFHQYGLTPDLSGRLERLSG